MINLTDAVKVYNSRGSEVVALNNVNLKIGQGEFAAVVGKSGSGKSTLLNILGGMDTLTSGKYSFFDTDISALTNEELHEFRKENVGFVFQNFELIDYYTVYENVELPLIARKIAKKDRKQMILDTLLNLDIIDLKDKYPNLISGGQKQRVAIARALLCGATLILADEPTGSLDKVNGQVIMDILSELNKTGKTIVVITHDPDIARKCKRIIHLEDGMII